MQVQALVHTVIAVTIIIGYVVLSALHEDGTPLLGILVGQGIGGAVSKLPTGSKP